MERLQKVIAESGYTSRRKAESLIKSGHVLVNGKCVKELGTKVSGDDLIMVDKILLEKEEKVYYMLNKPRGVICSSKDDKKRKTVVDLIDTNKRIYPIGRLDYDTTGLLLLTNDGKLANGLMHPSKKIEKTYLAKLNRIISIDDIHTLKKGIIIDKIKCKPKRVKLRSIDKEKNKSIVEVTIVEGRNHIVKKLFESMGYLVDKLTRVKYDFLTIDELKSGEYRLLTIKEVKKLYDSCYGNKTFR